MFSNGLQQHPCVSPPGKTCINQLKVDTEYCLLDIPRVMAIGMEGKKESRESMLLACPDDDDHHHHCVYSIFNVILNYVCSTIYSVFYSYWNKW